MNPNHESFREKKIISIGNVSELLGLSVRQIRYYEERGLVLPERSKKGTRKYSLQDIEALSMIANYIEEGMQTVKSIIELISKREKEHGLDNYRIFYDCNREHIKGREESKYDLFASDRRNRIPPENSRQVRRILFTEWAKRLVVTKQFRILFYD